MSRSARTHSRPRTARFRFLAPALLALAAAVAVALSGCAAASGPTSPTQQKSENSSVPEPALTPLPTATPNGTKVAFYGDSYTLGTGASSDDKRWSTIICRSRGWSEFNPSVNGLGFINNRTTFGPGDEPSEVIADKPDILFITMGLNDNFSYDRAATRIHEQIGDDFSRLKKALPDTRFIVVEPFWYTDDRPPSVAVIIGWVKDAAAAIGADYIPGASHWIEHHPEWMASDGLHPNDTGYAHMAADMDAALTKLGL